MSNICNILDFSFPQRSFSQNGEKTEVFLKKLCDSQISALNSIKDVIGTSIVDNQPIEGVREVYLRFIRFCQSNKNPADEFDKRELRLLTYALNFKEQQETSIFENANFLKIFLSLLKSKWRDVFISGLFDCYLSNWDSPNKISFDTLSKFLIDKIENYNGQRNLYLALKKNLKYFKKEKGDLDLGATLANSNTSISEVTKLLSLPDHWISYPYFSGVINGFFEKSKDRIENCLSDIADALEKHSISTKATKTNKLIVSKIICHTSNSNEILQNQVKDLAFKLVGDPEITSIWRPFEDYREVEISIINEGWNILKNWVARQFITVFFERCIDDPRRKLFWLTYSKEIKTFKVFGPIHIKRILKADNRVSEYVDNRFIVVPRGDSSALMFELGNHRMIEFSVEGYAFYAFRTNNEHAPSFFSNVNSINDFTDGQMPMLVRRRHYNIENYLDEGRLIHRDGTMIWEDVFTIWLKNKSGIDV